MTWLIPTHDVLDDTLMRLSNRFELDIAPFLLTFLPSLLVWEALL